MTVCLFFIIVQMFLPGILNPNFLYPVVMTNVTGQMAVVLRSETVKKCEDYFRSTVVRYG